MSSEKTSLLFYFKYNEGWTTNNSQYVVDYSGRGLDGVFNYYSAESRLNTSAIDESGLVKTQEKSDTIWLDKNLNFNSFSPALQTYFEQKIETAAEYDENNKHALWKKFPSWIYDEEGDLGTQNFKKLVQLISVYFDDLYNKIKEISSLKHQKYTTDLDGIYPFYDKIISSTGFDVTDLFSGVDGIENLASRNDTHIFEDKIYKVKNKIYQNIYNNLAYILKSKGTEKSIKSLLRSYGVDENLVKINLYADKSVFNAVETKTAEKIIRKKTVSLKNDQYISINSFTSTSGTLELQAFLPANTDSKIALLSTNAVSIFLKPSTDGGMVFELSSSAASDETDSFKVLDNQMPWNISLRADGEKHYLSATKYTTGEYYETRTASLDNTEEISEIIVGAAAAFSTDIRVADVALWNDILLDETLFEHAKDITNYGIPEPQKIPEKGVFYWDFEKIAAPNSAGEISILDIFNNNNGIGYGFTEGDLSFVKKEYVKTYKKLNFDTIESLETIQTLDEDDHYARSLNKKPEKVALFIENSMYQIISEEMINMFSDIGDYIFAFAEPSNAYASEYLNLKKIKSYFFSKVVNTPDIERYLEFYKWLDSSLGYLIDQIKPENANTHSGLKISIESHMLERNKYQYALPLMIDTKKNFDVKLASTAVADALVSASVSTDALGEALIADHLEDGRKTNVTIKNTASKNFSKNYEVLNTAGKTLNNRGDKENKSVFVTKFSSADGLVAASDTEEYSIYNSLLNKSIDTRKQLDEENATPLGTQTIKDSKRLTSGTETVYSNLFSSSGSAEIYVGWSGLPYIPPPTYRTEVFIFTIDLLTNLMIDAAARQEIDDRYATGYSQSGLLKAGKIAIGIKYKNQAGVVIDTVITRIQYSFDGNRYLVTPSLKITPTCNPGLMYGMDREPVECITFDSDFMFIASEEVPKTEYIEQPDSKFIQRAIPHYNDNYWAYGYQNYEQIPSLSILSQRTNNTFTSNGNPRLEPPVEWTVPVYHDIRVANALEDLQILSSYSSKIKRLANEDLYEELFGANKIDPGDTFLEKIKNVATSSILVNNFAKLENIYPRKEYHGLFDIRSKPNYEEGIDLTSTNTWGDNSYNRNSGIIRSFWNSDIEKRKRIDRDDNGELFDDTLGGAINCLGYVNNPTAISNITFNEFNIYNHTSSKPDLIDNGLPLGRHVYLFNGAADIGLFPFISLKNKLNLNYYNSICSIDSKNNIVFNTIKPPGYENYGDRYNIPIFTYQTGSVYGDIGPYGNAELLAFTKKSTNTNYNIIEKVQPKPQFVFNNYISLTKKEYKIYPIGSHPPGVQQGSTAPFNEYKITSSILINNSYQQGLDNKLSASYNSYSEYFLNIKYKSQNYSIIPEYIISNNLQDINGYNDIFKKDILLNLRGLNDNISLDESSAYKFKININKFINKDTNEFIIKFNGVKKLLPYAGFYPAERSKQIVYSFGQQYDLSSVQNNTNTHTKQAIQTLLQPLFAPGILFNSIKAGIAVDYPIFTSNSSELGYNNLYDADSQLLDTGKYFIYDNTYSVKELTTRTPFEAILDPNKLFSIDAYMYYLDPTRYSNIFRDQLPNDTQNIYPNVKLNTVNDTNNNVYKYSINNYISEIPNFFLNKNELTNFKSLPENKFLVSESGKKYVMYLKILKSPYFSMFTTDHSSNMIPVQSLFGPPCWAFYKGSEESVESAKADNGNEEMYLPFAPPYLRKNGQDTYIKFEYTGNGEKFSLDNLKNVSVLKYQEGKLHDTEVSENTTYYHAMNLDSCCNLFNLLSEPIKTSNSITGQEQTSAASATPNRRWVIQTKFESPLINYLNTDPLNSSTKEIEKIDTLGYGIHSYTSGIYELTNDTVDVCLSISSSQTNGIWNKIGKIPDDNNSVQLTLDDDLRGEDDGSLLELVGFKKEKTSIGSINTSKNIKEGILVLPYTASEKAKNNKLFRKFSGGTLDGKYVIALDNEKIKTILGFDYKTKTIKEIKKIFGTLQNLNYNNSIVKLIKNMLEYNVPPYLNWLDSTNNLDPFVFYVGEFEHTLSQQDLANIWQGTLPDIGKEPQEQTVEIRHKFSDIELLSEGIKEFLATDTLDGYVFKVKMRANTNYTSLIKDDKYTEENEQNIPWNTFNWPYDHFSLVELLNIQAGEGYTSDALSTEPTLVNTDIQARIVTNELERLKDREIKIPDTFKGNKS